MRYSKLISLLTVAYGAFAVVKPRHLANALEAPMQEAPVYDQLAHTYAGRDLAIGAAALLSMNPQVVTAAMLMRIAGDLSDATILGTSTERADVRTKVLGITLGYAALNAAALVADRRALR